MSLRTVALALFVALTPVVALTAPLERAAQADDDAAAVKAARAKFQEGVRAYDKGQYEKARAAFLQTYTLHKHPAVLLNLGQSCLRSGHTLEADGYFQQYLREAQMKPEQRKAAEDGLAEAREKLGRLDIHATAGAAVTVDGNAAGTAPITDPIDVEPGAHTVHSGAIDQQVTAVAGQTLSVDVTAPVAASAPPPPSSGKSIFAPPRSMTPVYIAGGLTVAGIATGVVMLIQKGAATSKANDAVALINQHGGNDQTCSQTDAATVAKFGDACSALSTDNSNRSTDGTVAAVGFIVGGAALVGGVVYYLVAPKADAGDDAKPAAKSGDTRASWSVVPNVGRGYEGLSWAGSF